MGGRSMDQRYLLHDFAAEQAVSLSQLPESRRFGYHRAERHPRTLGQAISGTG